MVRFGVIGYLMLATSAGPAWCCCNLTGLATFVAPAHPSSPFVSLNRLSLRCCSLHDKNGYQPCRPARDVPPHQSPCPCHDNQQPSAVLPGTNDLSGASPARLIPERDLTGMVELFLSPTQPTPDAATQATVGSIGFPFSTPRDILRALHILLC